ncbi:hypothetical protein L533_1248, partial [Bordetella bronchiseptica OSU553]
MRNPINRGLAAALCAAALSLAAPAAWAHGDGEQ